MTDMVSNSSSSHVRDSVPILLPRTMVWRFKKKKEDALQSVKLAGYRAGSVCCFCIKMTENYNHENILDRLSLKNQYDKLNL